MKKLETVDVEILGKGHNLQVSSDGYHEGTDIPAEEEATLDKLMNSGVLNSAELKNKIIDWCNDMGRVEQTSKRY